MRLLIADLLRRHWWNPVFFSIMLAAIFGATAAGVSPSWAFRASMGMAFGIGPALMVRYVPRAIWYLPISKRDIWRAGWLLSTVGVTLLTTAIKLAAILVPQVRASVSLASVALSSVYDFAYAGVGCGLVVLANRPQPTSGWRRRVSAALKGSAEFILPLGMVVGFYGDFMAPVLPTHWTDLTPRSIAVLVAALGVAGATYFHSPVPLTPTNRIQRPARVRTGPARLELGGLSGLPYLLVHETAWTLLIGGSMVIGSILVVFVVATFLQSPGGFAGFLRALLLRLDGRVTPSPGDSMEFVIPLIGFAVFITSLIARFPTMIRHLRVLPLSATRLNLLLIAGPAVTWLVAWTALLALHYVVVGESAASYHAAALLGLIGLSAIVQALTLRLSNVLRTFWFAVSVGVVPILFLIDAPSPSALTAIGASLITAAALLNRRALTRQSTYTPIGRTLGVASTPR